MSISGICGGFGIGRIRENDFKPPVLWALGFWMIFRPYLISIDELLRPTIKADFQLIPSK
jgi:hypothetical protein